MTMSDGRCSCGAYTESSSGLCGACIQRGVTIYSSSAVSPMTTPPADPVPAAERLLKQMYKSLRTKKLRWN
jgi:hypothetical protein